MLCLLPIHVLKPQSPWDGEVETFGVIRSWEGSQSTLVSARDPKDPSTMFSMWRDSQKNLDQWGSLHQTLNLANTVMEALPISPTVSDSFLLFKSPLWNFCYSSLDDTLGRCLPRAVIWKLSHGARMWNGYSPEYHTPHPPWLLAWHSLKASHEAVFIPFLLCPPHSLEHKVYT